MEWNDFLTDRDRAVFADSGFGASVPLGSRPALLVIDVTYNFCGETRKPVEESVKERRRSCGEEAWDALDHIEDLLKASRAKKIPVIYTAGIDFRLDGVDAGRWIDKNPGFLIDAARDLERAELRGNEIMPSIAPEEHEILLRKTKPSAFFATPLISLLNDRSIDTLIVTGTTTSGCIRATVIDAFSYNYRVAVARDAVFDRGQASHWINLFDMHQKYAEVLDTPTILSYLDGVDTH